jgi:hypothetical protein
MAGTLPNLTIPAMIALGQTGSARPLARGVKLRLRLLTDWYTPLAGATNFGFMSEDRCSFLSSEL